MASPHQTKVDIAWASGLFDGEGCIILTPFGAKILTVDMIHSAAIWKLQRTLGGAVYEMHRKRGLVYRWTSRGDHTTSTLKLMLPHLTTKLAEARILLDYSTFQAKNVHRWESRSRLATRKLATTRLKLTRLKGRRNARKV